LGKGGCNGHNNIIISQVYPTIYNGTKDVHGTEKSYFHMMFKEENEEMERKH